jgi:predicted nucleic acid-binding protein
VTDYTLDSSALVKRYAPEAGSDWILEITEPTYDAIQLATALIANDDLVEQDHPPLVFVTSDDDLLTAAQTEGLTVRDPVEEAT